MKTEMLRTEIRGARVIDPAMFAQPYMQNALLVGTIVAILAGLVLSRVVPKAPRSFRRGFPNNDLSGWKRLR